MADEDTAVILRETMTCPKARGCQVEVLLTSSSISWVTDNKKLDVKINLCDVLVARVDNSTNNKSVEESSLIIHYVKHVFRKKEHILSDQTEVFHSSGSVCTQWQEKVNELVLEKFPHRPKRLLVFVNPISGKSSGPKVYRSRAEHLFSVCGVSTDVRETTHAHHTEEVLADYDLTKTDGIVTVGGDGTYAEAVNGLARRAMREADEDENDPNVDVKRLALPVGIIPSGTGDGIVDAANTTKDVTTAILLIILGYKIPKDVASIHHGNKLMVYSVLLTGLGLFSYTIHKAENNRQLGRFRYFYAGLYGIAKHKVFEAEVEYLASADSDKATGSGEATAETSGQSSGWQHKSGNFVQVDNFMASLSGSDQQYTLGNGSLYLNFVNPCGRIAHAKYLKKRLTGDPEAFNSGVGEEVMVKAYRVRVAGEWRTDPLSRVLNVDGDIVNLPEPDFSVRCHKGISELYSWPLSDSETTTGCGANGEAASNT